MSHLRNDITVLKLSSKVQLTSTVGTVCLPAKGSRAKIGAHCWTSGAYTFSNELGQIFWLHDRLKSFLLSQFVHTKQLLRFNLKVRQR